MLPDYEGGGNARAGDVRLKCKQMTRASIAGELADCAPCDRKSKRWVEITDAGTR